MVVYRPTDTGPCPTISWWDEDPVFPSASEPELKRFCLYRFLPAGDPPDYALGWLPSGPKHEDCLVATPAASAAWDAIHEAFQDQIALAPLAPASRTWIAIVDSSQPSSTGDGEAVLGNNPHGFALGRIALETGCPGGSSSGGPCAVHVHHELALPLKFDGTTWSTPAGGGHFGYQTDVASAIARAVDRWWSDRSSANDRLIVNLSLGWLDAFGGPHGHTDSERTSVRSVYVAIEKAVCRGALVYTAAGNRSGGTMHANGPIFPAGWAKKSKPSNNRCAAQFSGPFPGFSAAGALVEAVGGVDGKDELLGNGRIGSRPRLVAPGFLGAAKDAAGGEAPLMTGTSVSTVVASAAAAIAWAHVPDRNARQISDLTYQGGQPLTEPGDTAMCFGGVCPTVRRASVCGALKAACAAVSGACASPTCSDRAPYADARPALFQSMFPPADITIPIMDFVPVGITPPQCGTTATLYRPAGSAGPGEAPCLDRQIYNGLAHADTGPQPTNNGCPDCTFQLASTVSLAIKLVAADVDDPLSTPSVLLRTNAGEFRYSLHEYGAFTLNAGPTYSITGIPRDGFTSIKSATLSAVDSRGALWTAELAKAAP